MFFSLAAIILLCGCGYMQLVGEQITASITSIDLQSPLTATEAESGIDGLLTGTIRGSVPGNRPVAVAVFATSYSAAENRGSERLTTYVLLPRPGPYALFVPAGRYKIMVFVDVNRNFVLEPGEIAGSLTRSEPVTVRPNEVRAGLNIELRKSGVQPFDFPVSLQNLPLRQVPENVMTYGGAIELDNEIFQRKYASMGLWKPAHFIEKIGVHLYALEPIDARKVPVLFVHGINGTPRDWKYLAKGLDNRRFQPWFYYYPSGLRLNLVSGLLHEKIRFLHHRYGFEKLVVVAHSMGGLVSRAFINECANLSQEGCPHQFVSISTPWGGDKTARVGLNNSPVDVPSWEDVAEGSQFIEDLYRQELPPELGFYLFFSYGGNRRFHWNANDGTVTLESQLDPRAKATARRIEGFYEDHITVLASSDVEQKLNALLATGNRTPSDPPRPFPPKGRAAVLGTATRDPSIVSQADPMSPEVKRYVTMLQSVESDRKIEAARRIYRKRLKHPAIFETAAQQLRKGYRVNLADSDHIDAMAWMCNLLGVSGQAAYRSLLDMVAQETPNRKIRKHALKGMRRLSR